MDLNMHPIMIKIPEDQPTMTTPDQTNKDETPELFIQPAENGGFTVKSGSPHAPAIKKVLMGAYSCAADLIEDMPELLCLDGITAAAYTEDDSIGLNIFDDEGWDYPDEEQPLFDLGDRAAELNEREEEMDEREDRFREYEMRLIEYSADLGKRMAELEARKADLDRRTDALNKCERKVYEHAAELSKREHTLDMREKAVARHEEELGKRELSVTDFHFTSKRGLDGAI